MSRLVYRGQILVPRLEFRIDVLGVASPLGLETSTLLLNHLVPHVDAVAPEGGPFKDVSPREFVSVDGTQEFDDERRNADNFGKYQAEMYLEFDSLPWRQRTFIVPRPTVMNTVRTYPRWTSSSSEFDVSARHFGFA